MIDVRGNISWASARTAVIVIAAWAGLAAPAKADPGVEGQWSPLQNYPVVPVSMGLMPDGKIVAWDQANKPPNFGSVPNNGAAMILDPATGAITRSTNVAPRTTFCSLIASLPDGRLAVIGGGSNSGSGAIYDVQIYDEDSKTFSTLGMMNARRWYPGGTLDRDGNPIVAGGTGAGIERFDQLTGASTFLDQTFPTNWYPDLIRTADSRFVIEDVGDNATAGPGRYLLTSSGLQTISNNTLLQARRRGIRTLIGPHKLFYNSGGTSRVSLIIDVSSGTPTYAAAAQSTFPHMTGTAVTLPTGDVLAIGGNSSGSDTKGTPVMTPELYSVANNTWTNMANLERRRTYHSVAALLPDGRVWSAGSSFDEVQEPNGQFFSPPYLFRQDGSGQLAPRPTATDAPAAINAGQAFSVATNNPTGIARAAFIRIAATTHQVNAGQAFVPLTTTPVGGRVQMTAPSIDAAPPGYYMLFLIDGQGVPSVAPIIRLDKAPGSAPQPRVTQSSQFEQSRAAWNAFDGETSQSPGSKINHTLDESQPWWEVDLGQSRNLDSVTVRLRADCCTDRNRDLWVFASDTPFSSTTVSGLQSQPGVTAVRLQTPEGDVNVAQLNRTVRYIRVQDPDTTGFLHLAEVTPNIAGQNSPPLATQSTTEVASDVSRGAGRAIDGNANGNASAGFVSVTKLQSEPWWQVDLGRERELGTVDVSLRNDPDANRDLWVFSSRTPFTSNTIAGTQAQPGVTATHLLIPSGSSGVATLNATARHVRIQAPGASTRLSLAEVGFTDNRQPSVSLTAPSEGATFTEPASYTVSANASDPDGTIEKVEFFRGSTLMGTDASAPFSVQDSGVPAGTHSLTAKAFDNGGATTTSAPVTITVDPPAPTGPVAAYAFDEASGATAVDETGNGHDGSINGATRTTGHSGGALSFDGDDDMVSVPDHAQLDLTDGFTVEAWVKPRTLNGWRMVAFKEAPPWNLAYGLYASAPGSRLASAWTDRAGVFSDTEVPLNTWTHLATTYDQGTLRIFVNGSLAGTRAGVPAPAPSNAPFRIGGNVIWDFETLDGVIDDVRLWNVALSGSELAG